MKKTGKYRSLSFTLTIVFLVLGMAILVIITGFDLYFSFQTQKKDTASYLALTAQNAANTVKNFIQGKFTILETAASLGKLVTSPQDEQKIILEKQLGLEPSFRQVVLLNAQKQELFRVSRLSKALSAQLMKYDKFELFSQIGRKKRYIGPVYIDSITCEPMVVMAVPVTDVFGDIKGALMTEVNLKFLWSLVDNLYVGKNGLAYVVDREGDLIAFRDISRVLRGENIIRLREVKKFVCQEEFPAQVETSISKGIQNRHVVTSHISLGVPNWAVVVELPVTEAYRFLIRQIIMLVLVMLGVFVMVVVISIYLSKKIINPIKKLRDATRMIGKDSLDTKIEIDSKDEIGELAESFNHMMKDLNMTTVSRDALMEEVAERKKAEAKLKAMTEELARSNKELEQFAYVASHDLQEPLRMISSYIGLLNKRYRDKFDKDGLEFIEFAVDGAARMRQLVNDLLAYSRVGTQGKPFQKTDCGRIFEKAVKYLEISIAEHKGKVTHDPLPELMADEGQLIQLFQNIIGNALKFCKDCVPSVHVSAKRDGDKWLFGIRDNGIGIAAEHLDRIFQIFQRLHGRGEYQGTGIGLAVCKKIVERHGGRIWVESEVGKGTTFWFTIAIT